jgi:3-oxoacyl-[acyl-carrier-protein] synthase II
MQDSQLDRKNVNVDRMGVCIASGIGGIQSIENSHDQLKNRGSAKVSPFFIPMSLINLASGNVAIDVGAKGQCWSVVTACAASANAIGEAFHKIRDGYQDIVIAGGAEASITPLAMAGFQSMRALYTGNDPQRASIPFDAKRSGFVMGEGAGILILEEYEHAKKRNAKIYGEIVGYGTSCDAHHITAPLDDGSGGAKAMSLALEDASIRKDQIDYINAHGTSTPLNDKSETKAVKKAFERYATTIPISSTKSNTGHLLGASGAIEASICVQALQHDTIPATIHYQEKDPECDLDIVANTNRKAKLEYVMSNSLGFGGHNASLIFKKVSA